MKLPEIAFSAPFNDDCRDMPVTTDNAIGRIAWHALHTAYAVCGADNNYTAVAKRCSEEMLAAAARFDAGYREMGQ